MGELVAMLCPCASCLMHVTIIMVVFLFLCIRVITTTTLFLLYSFSRSGMDKCGWEESSLINGNDQVRP